MHWLHNAAPDCHQTKQELDVLRKKLPEWNPKYPEFLVWVERGDLVPKSPWKARELLDKPAEEWLPQLQSYEGNEFFGPNRDGLLLAIRDAAKQKFTWGLQLADSLINEKSWDFDLWDVLIRAWANMELDKAQLQKVLLRLEATELYLNHNLVIARLIRNLLGDSSKSYVNDLLPIANKIADAQWEMLDRKIQKVIDEMDWSNEAINHPAGVLTEFWIRSLSFALNRNEQAPQVFDNEFRKVFSTIVDDDSFAGNVGRCILARHFCFLLHVNEQWTRQKLLPFFATKNDGNFGAVWDGFLRGGQITPRAAELLERPFLKAFERIKKIRSHQLTRNFVWNYTRMLCFYVSDPLEKWVPNLLKDGSKHYPKTVCVGGEIAPAAAQRRAAN